MPTTLRLTELDARANPSFVFHYDDPEPLTLVGEPVTIDLPAVEVTFVETTAAAEVSTGDSFAAAYAWAGPTGSSASASAFSSGGGSAAAWAFASSGSGASAGVYVG